MAAAAQTLPPDLGAASRRPDEVFAEVASGTAGGPNAGAVSRTGLELVRGLRGFPGGGRALPPCRCALPGEQRPPRVVVANGRRHSSACKRRPPLGGRRAPTAAPLAGSVAGRVGTQCPGYPGGSGT